MSPVPLASSPRPAVRSAAILAALMMVPLSSAYFADAPDDYGTPSLVVRDPLLLTDSPSEGLYLAVDDMCDVYFSLQTQPGSLQPTGNCYESIGQAGGYANSCAMSTTSWCTVFLDKTGVECNWRTDPFNGYNDDTDFVKGRCSVLRVKLDGAGSYIAQYRVATRAVSRQIAPPPIPDPTKETYVGGLWTGILYANWTNRQTNGGEPRVESRLLSESEKDCPTRLIDTQAFQIANCVYSVSAELGPGIMTQTANRIYFNAINHQAYTANDQPAFRDFTVSIRCPWPAPALNPTCNY